MREYFNASRRDGRRAFATAGCTPAISAGSTTRGRLFITGRKKEIIVLSSGKNLYPEEIEAHYRQSRVHQGAVRARA